MILYLDASAIIKLYVAEPGADHVRQSLERARRLYTHLITYAEMHAALARLHRMGRKSAAGLREHVREFERDWKKMTVVTPDEHMIRRAGDLAEQFGLRGYDSVHLAATESLALDRRYPIHFASFCRTLNAAAGVLVDERARSAVFVGDEQVQQLVFAEPSQFLGSVGGQGRWVGCSVHSVVLLSTTASASFRECPHVHLAGIDAGHSDACRRLVDIGPL